MGSPWDIIAFSRKDTWALADSSNDCVCLLTDDQDQLIRGFGGTGNNDGLFDHSDGLDGHHLFVVDRDDH